MKATVLIIGTGNCAQHTSGVLEDSGFKVIRISEDIEKNTSQNKKIKSVSTHGDVTITGLHGTVGDFEISLSGEDSLDKIHAQAIIIAEDPVRTADFSALGLTPTPQILSLSQIQPLLENPPEKQPFHFEKKRVLFLFGLSAENRPTILAEVLRYARRMQEHYGAQCNIIAGNLKVASSGLESQCHKAKCAGIRFFKPDPLMPDFQLQENKAPMVSFFEPSLRETVRLEPDMVIVDEYLFPARNLSRLASVMALETDNMGFIQSLNVHRLPIFTNRRGVFAIGPARGYVDPLKIPCEAKNAHSALLSISATCDVPELIPEINIQRCIHCLTCFRVCPHHAIRYRQGRLTISSGCYDCRICMAECPREAISIPGNRSSFNDRFQQYQAKEPLTAVFTPRLAVFGCKHSAEPSIQMAQHQHKIFDAHMEWSSLPCAGSITENQILAAFKRGADGILILTCHPGNCHSGNGDQIARKHLGRISDIAAQIGIDDRRFLITSLAANTGIAFIEKSQAFIEILRTLGSTTYNNKDHP